MSKENGFIPLRRGLWEHLRDGRMSPMTALAFIYICSQADTRSGIWKGSAGALVTELGIKIRTARDVLERLEHGDYIRRFPVPGKHVCYPILVHKFAITQGQHHGEQLDALSATFSNGSIDLRYFSSEQHVEEHAEHNGEHGASQRRREKREKKKKKKQNHPEEDDVAVLRPASILERAEKALLEKYSDEACFIQAGLQIIQIRVYNSGCNPKTPAYYVESYENLKESEKDWQVVEWHAQNPTSSDRLNRVNVLILRAEKESKKTGRDVITCFHDLRQDPHCYDSVAIP